MSAHWTGLLLLGNISMQQKMTACIDHHVSNNGFADVNHVRGEISSASEVLYGLLDSDKIDRSIAVPIYTGMAHDTGVFQYSSTTPETMRIAGELMKTGFDFSRIIDESFTRKHIFRIRSWDVSWQRVFSFRMVSVWSDI